MAMVVVVRAVLCPHQVPGLEQGGRVQPAGKGSAGLEAAGLACQQDKGELRGLVRDRGVSAGAVGASADETNVPRDEPTERTFVTGFKPGTEEFAVVWFGGGMLFSDIIRRRAIANRKILGSCQSVDANSA